MANTEIRSDLHRIADALVAGSTATSAGDEPAVPERADGVRGALVAHYHAGYVEGLHDMAEAVVAYLTSRPRRGLGESPDR